MPRKKHQLKRKIARELMKRLQQEKKRQKQKGNVAVGSSDDGGTVRVCEERGGEEILPALGVGVPSTSQQASLSFLPMEEEEEEEELTSQLSIRPDLEMEEDVDIRLYLSESEEEEEEEEERYYTETLNDESSVMVVKLPPAQVRKTLFEEAEKEIEGAGEGDTEIIEGSIATIPENIVRNMVAAIGQCKECNGKLKLHMQSEIFDSDIKVRCEVCDEIMFESKAEKTKVESEKEITKVTASIVYQSMMSGTGLPGVNNVCTALGKKKNFLQCIL